ncbi:MAG: aspartate--tRNA ligase [Actinomycetota bacterium]|nr:aspartate--tRNA ligase [Actinomycetota bacterium]MDA8208652.1 aspartate--tRNA ligase [Actinomycetota bacterium]
MIKAAGLRTHYCAEVTAQLVGEKASLCGWVNSVRDHGEHLSFVDIRDHTGTVQIVTERNPELRTESAIRAVGVVARRPEGTDNPNIASGEVELREASIELLGPAAVTPFTVSGHSEVEESTRLKYRYLDIRRERMQNNLRTRAKVNQAIRAAMERQGFCEVETPLLWTPTPEGAREFLVPSRLQPGNFYVLPQSPQIAKQLLMVGGFDRYYQIARCLRDEDLRADRQFEFTQLDMEASFVTQQDVRAFVTEAMVEVVRATRGLELEGIGQITWFEAMDRYGVDKPDLRFGSPLVDLTELLGQGDIRAFAAPCVKGIKAPTTEQLSRSRLDALVDRAKSLGAKGLAWFRVVEGEQGVALESPLAKFLDEERTAALIDALGLKVGDLALAVADSWETAVKVLGQIRLDLGRPGLDHSELHFVWVVDFPLFEGLDENGNPVSAHHPFTMPNEEDFELLETEPLKVRSQSYDLVLNGWELGSGSIRIHRGDIQAKIFEVIGIDPEEAASRFGFLLDAFRFGAPPHGGFAFGIDRLAAMMSGEENIREVIAFPKTQSGVDPLTNAPKPVAKEVLDLVGLTVKARRQG